jgi:serine/threonine-protein kinase
LDPDSAPPPLPKVAFEAPVEAPPGGPADGSTERPQRGHGAEGALAEIDAAITALVDAGGSTGPESAPLDVAEAARPPPATEDLVGTMLRGRFLLERKIGRGAQAQVYLARDQVLERPVAIKVLSAHLAEDPDALEGFLSEARLAAQVHHPGCLAVFDFGREGDLTFLAMEHFRGRSLRALLRGGPLEPVLALHLARRLAEALAAVHAAGIVHRDVKPSNVLVDRFGQAKLSDFGVAVRLETPDSPAGDGPDGLMVGTLRYMAPEQARGLPPDPRIDIFALGALLWEMLAGRPAFEPTVEALKARMTATAPPLPDDVPVDETARRIIRGCLSPAPDARPPSAARVAELLRRAQGKLRAARRAGNGPSVPR